MRTLFLSFTVLLLSMSAHAATGIYFSSTGTFVVPDQNNGRKFSTQDYVIDSIEYWSHAESSSAIKAFDAWKNCYESKSEAVDFPIPWPVAHYFPFIENNKVNVPMKIDNQNKVIVVDEAQIFSSIQQAFENLNQRTNGKCTIKSTVDARIHVIAADGAKRSFDVSFATKNQNLYMQYRTTKIEDAYNIDTTKKAIIGLPNRNSPVPVFGDMY